MTRTSFWYLNFNQSTHFRLNWILFWLIVGQPCQCWFLWHHLFLWRLQNYINVQWISISTPVHRCGKECFSLSLYLSHTHTLFRVSLMSDEFKNELNWSFQFCCNSCNSCFMFTIKCQVPSYSIPISLPFCILHVFPLKTKSKRDGWMDGCMDGKTEKEEKRTLKFTH